MARKEFLDYVWKYCIEPQLGYSFSLNHTLPYSVIAVQEANLATRWNPLYWHCACLCVNAGNYASDLGGEDEEESVSVDIEEGAEEETADKKEKRVAPNYTKIAKAIADAQHSGVKIELPDINNAQVDFVPDVKDNSIYYSLQAVTAVGVDLLNKIMENRPFSSLEDFIDRVSPTFSQMLGLIKAGCFNNMCKKTQRGVLAQFLQLEADKRFPIKEKLTAVQLKKMLDLGWKPAEFLDEIRVFKFKKYIDAKQNDAANKRYVLTEEQCQKFFQTFIEPKLNMAKNEYEILPGGVIGVKASALKRVHDGYIQKVVDFLNTEEGRKAFQNMVQGDFIKDTTERYFYGSESRWEMETMSFYYSGHELESVNAGLYGIMNFDTLPETGDTSVHAIAGTVVGTDNTKHIVTVLTKYGIVSVKFFGETYARFNKKISTIDPETKKKTVIDDTWFKRGTKLIFHGQRRENMFYCKGLKTTYGVRYAGLIEDIHTDGTLDIRYRRASVK